MERRVRSVDVLIVGGGITGAGLLRDCAMRGLRALLVEKGSLGGGTTHASTRLIHGGLRYLLYDRLATHVTSWDSGHIVRVARPLLTRVPIVWPVYRGHAHGLETVETVVEEYDRFQGMKLGLPHLRLTADAVKRLVPGVAPEGLVGGVTFDEWWVRPVELVRKNVASAVRHGGEAIEHARPLSFIEENGRLLGAVIATPQGELEVRASCVVNAGGPWGPLVARRMGLELGMRLMRGTHLIFQGRLVPTGLLLEAVDRKRYVFLLPLGDETLLGPTDVPMNGDPDQARPSEDEIAYLIASARRYFPAWPERFSSSVCGVRPILGQRGPEKLLTRDYELLDHERRDGLAGALTIAGGKMSAYRLMAEDAADLLCRKLGRWAPCRTHLETLDGAPVGDVPDHRLPSHELKTFLARHPHLRELHSLAHLGAAFAKHALRRRRESTAADFAERYGSGGDGEQLGAAGAALQGQSEKPVQQAGERHA